MEELREALAVRGLVATTELVCRMVKLRICWSQPRGSHSSKQTKTRQKRFFDELSSKAEL